MKRMESPFIALDSAFTLLTVREVWEMRMSNCVIE